MNTSQLRKVGEALALIAGGALALVVLGCCAVFVARMFVLAAWGV